MIWIVGLLSRDIAACSSMSWLNASSRKDLTSQSLSIVHHHHPIRCIIKSIPCRAQIVKGKVERKTYISQADYLLDWWVKSLISCIVEVPRDRGSLGVTSDRFVLVVKKRILHFEQELCCGTIVQLHRWKSIVQSIGGPILTGGRSIIVPIVVP